MLSPTDDLGQTAQRAVYGLGIWEKLGNDLDSSIQQTIRN
jgi:hypothetical protein